MFHRHVVIAGALTATEPQPTGALCDVCKNYWHPGCAWCGNDVRNEIHSPNQTSLQVL